MRTPAPRYIQLKKEWKKLNEYLAERKKSSSRKWKAAEKSERVGEAAENSDRK